MVKDLPPPPAFRTKAECRAWGRLTRSLRPGTLVSARVSVHLRSWLECRRSATVLLYAAFGDEIDIGALASPVAHGLDGPHRLATTRTPEDGPLTIHPWPVATELHRYGFVQPTVDSERIEPAEVDVVLVPGMVFDHAGRRLGYGRGYYDRLLADCQPSAAVGVVPSWMVVERVPTERHDVAMTHLATEHGVVLSATQPS